MATAKTAVENNTESKVEAALLLNEKMKFAIKSAASLVLVYLIGFSQGWSNITTAATTVMLIAAVGSLENAVMNGLLRVLGSIIGAVIGMVLIALFPQERFLYLLLLSLSVTLVLHLTRTYKGDMTVFMLTGMTMMMMFQNGDTDNVFLYGIDKAFMTLFGIAVYTLVGILIWPVSGKKSEFEYAQQLAKALKKRYEARFEDEVTQNRLHNESLQTQELLLKSIPQIPGTMETNFSPAQWRSLMRDFKALDTLLSLLPTSGELSNFPKPLSYYLKGFESVRSQIEALFDAIIKGWPLLISKLQTNLRRCSVPRSEALHSKQKTCIRCFHTSQKSSMHCTARNLHILSMMYISKRTPSICSILNISKLPLLPFSSFGQRLHAGFYSTLPAVLWLSCWLQD